MIPNPTALSRRPLAAGLFAAGLLATPALAQDHSLDGIWFAGYRIGSEAISVQVVFAGEYGMLYTQYIEPLAGTPTAIIGAPPPGECDYALRHEAGTVTAIRIKNGLDCPDTIPYAFALTPEGQLAVLSGGQPVQFLDSAGNVDLVLEAEMRPPLPETASVIPADFDTLGVAPRQTLAEVEANLIGTRGWHMLPEGERNGSERYENDDWVSAKRVYIRDDTEVYMQPADKIEVTYGVVPAGEPLDGALVLEIKRASAYGPGDQPDPAATAQALDGKYGPATGMTERDGQGYRFFGPDGKALAQPYNGSVHNGHCPALDPAGGPTFHDFGNNSRDSHPGCGSWIYVTNGRDGETGLISFMILEFYNDDTVVMDAWKRQAGQIARDVTALLDATGTGAAPDL